MKKVNITSDEVNYLRTDEGRRNPLHNKRSRNDGNYASFGEAVVCSDLDSLDVKYREISDLYEGSYCTGLYVGVVDSFKDGTTFDIYSQEGVMIGMVNEPKGNTFEVTPKELIEGIVSVTSVEPEVSAFIPPQIVKAYPDLEKEILNRMAKDEKTNTPEKQAQVRESMARIRDVLKPSKKLTKEEMLLQQEKALRELEAMIGK